ncbi:hypothetical protein BTVI_128232 [Pitangus sulphuratus]|nr:hypothetical protein BTVI_128232 [Pitangus sulphuratus]
MSCDEDIYEAQVYELGELLLSVSAQKESSEASLKAALSTAREKCVLAMKLCQVLCSVHESFPDLQPVMQELGCVGLLTERSGEKPRISKWKVNSESQVKSLHKAFHFCCCLKVHVKRCWVSRGKQIQCKEYSQVKLTKKELEKHQLEVHGVVGMAKKKKQQLPVVCDICGREFAHASDHEDPYGCKKGQMSFATLQERHNP